MNSGIAIKVENVYKSFRIPHERNSSLKSAAINLFKKKKYTRYEAAKGISFEVKRGEFLGVIGRNGCGKSTMLKMLAGIYVPEKGKITIDGTLSPFLELGVGFNPELSARDNVYLNGVILGLTRKEIDEKFDEIIKFSELEEFVDQKLKNFSSGMQVRLAFSVAIHAHADILLIDEVLAVGDVNFQRKCFNVFKELKASGKTIVFVSHSMDMVEKFCDRVLVFEKAEIAFDGGAQEAAIEYLKLQSQSIDTEKTVSFDTSVVIKDISLNDKNENGLFGFKDKVQLTITVDSAISGSDLGIGFGLFEEETGLRVAGFNSHSDEKKLGFKRGINKFSLSIDPEQILQGRYYFQASIFKGDPDLGNYLASYDSKRTSKYLTFPKSNQVSPGIVSLKHCWDQDEKS